MIGFIIGVFCRRSIRRCYNGAAELPQGDGVRGRNIKTAAQSRGIGGEGMREILFRGKKRDNGEWAYGDLCQVLPGCECKFNLIFSQEECATSSIVLPETVGQYTGLTDKNGKKIFEGDICNISIPRIDGGFNRHNKCLCSYEDGMYKFSSYSDIYFCMGNGYGYPDTCHQNIEVIGNIHDNPELLEVEE